MKLSSCSILVPQVTVQIFLLKLLTKNIACKYNKTGKKKLVFNQKAPVSKLVFASGIVRGSLNYLFCRDGGRELMSVSDNMVIEVVSALSAVSGREVAGNWMRMVYTESPSPLQSVENIMFKTLSTKNLNNLFLDGLLFCLDMQNLLKSEHQGEECLKN